MCIKRYHTARNQAKIKPVTFDRVTDKYLHKGGRRHAIKGNYDNYHTTYQEAKSFLLRQALGNVEGCQLRLNDAQTFLHKVQALRQE